MKIEESEGKDASNEREREEMARSAYQTCYVATYLPGNRENPGSRGQKFELGEGKGREGTRIIRRYEVGLALLHPFIHPFIHKACNRIFAPNETSRLRELSLISTTSQQSEQQINEVTADLTTCCWAKRGGGCKEERIWVGR